MIATYLLWHATVAEALERPEAERFLDPHVHLLDAPSMYSYALRAFGGQSGWDESELVTLADEREALLRQQPKNLLELPARLDATLRIDLAQRAWNRGDQIACLEQLGKAIGLLPGTGLRLQMSCPSPARRLPTEPSVFHFTAYPR